MDACKNSIVKEGESARVQTVQAEPTPVYARVLHSICDIHVLGAGGKRREEEKEDWEALEKKCKKRDEENVRRTHTA